MLLSQKINNLKFGMYLDFIGKVTLPIMTFLFLSFKLMTALLIYLFHYPISYLKEWPVPSELNDFWILYSIVGIIIPIGISLLFNRIRQKLFIVNSK